MRTKEEYENLINSSPLFEVDRIANPVLFDTEWRSFVVLLAELFKYYDYKNKPMETYSLELMECANECVKYYNKSNGLFINFFRHALSKKTKKSKARNSINEIRQGIVLTKNEDKLIRQIMRYASSYNKNYKDEKTQQKIAMALGLDIETVKELIYINQNATAMSNEVITENGEAVNLLDLQPSNNLTPEEQIILEDDIFILAEKLEKEYDNLQERTKPIIKKLLTAKLIAEIGVSNRYEKFFNGRNYIDNSIVEDYINDKKVPTAREIADLLGINEASVSRTFKTFLNRIQKQDNA